MVHQVSSITGSLTVHCSLNPGLSFEPYKLKIWVIKFFSLKAKSVYFSKDHSRLGLPKLSLCKKYNSSMSIQISFNGKVISLRQTLKIQ